MEAKMFVFTKRSIDYILGFYIASEYTDEKCIKQKNWKKCEKNFKTL